MIIALAQDDFIPTLDIVGSGSDLTLRMSALTIKTIPLAGDRLLLPGTPVNYTTTSVLHILVPVVLLFTPLLSWPAAGWREAGCWLTRCSTSTK